MADRRRAVGDPATIRPKEPHLIPVPYAADRGPGFTAKQGRPHVRCLVCDPLIMAKAFSDRSLFVSLYLMGVGATTPNHDQPEPQLSDRACPHQALGGVQEDSVALPTCLLG